MKKNLDFAKLSAHSGPESSPGFLLWQTSTSWRRTIEETLKEFNLTHPQFVVLATLGWLTRNGDLVAQASVGKMACLDPNTASQVLKGLEQKEMISRIQSPDGRVKNPILTTFGKKTLLKALPAVETADAQFFADLSKAEMDQFLALFLKLSDVKK